jgi:geranylgeranyl diphosphate synthase type I
MGWTNLSGDVVIGKEGKGLRPSLCLFTCEAVGGSVNDAMPAAVALEFIHNFSLIHDDIQDRDEFRHGRETLWKIWGIPKALMAGNVLKVLSDHCLMQLVTRDIGFNRVICVVEMLTEACLTMIEGQSLDISYEGNYAVSIEEYFNMISRKTGALIQCSMEVGATIGTEDHNLIHSLRDIGASLGTMFQIRDDVLGIWGDQHLTGKPVGADIKRKKESFPLVYSLTKATKKQRELLFQIYNKEEIDDQDTHRVLDLMEDIGVRRRAYELTLDYHKAAKKSLKDSGLNTTVQTEFENLFGFLLERSY